MHKNQALCAFTQRAAWGKKWGSHGKPGVPCLTLNQPKSRIRSRQKKIDLQALLVTKVVEFLPPWFTWLFEIRAGKG